MPMTSQHIRRTKDEVPRLAARGQDANQRSPQPDHGTANSAEQPGTATAKPLPGSLQRIFTAGVLVQTDVSNRHRTCTGKNERQCQLVGQRRGAVSLVAAVRVKGQHERSPIRTAAESLPSGPAVARLFEKNVPASPK